MFPPPVVGILREVFFEGIYNCMPVDTITSPPVG